MKETRHICQFVWAPLATAWRVFITDRGGCLQIWMVAANS